MTERRCPNCAGLVGADADWCTQCFTRLEGGQARPRTDEAGPGEARSGAAQASSARDLADEADRSSEAAERDRKPLSEPETAPAELTTEREAEPLSEAGPASAEPLRVGRGIRTRGEEIVWDCPACGSENPIDVMVCAACGTSFGRMLREPEERVSVDPGRAERVSLLFPGAGHFIAGRRGEGIARAVVFAFALIAGLASLSAARSGSGGPYVALTVLAFAAAAALYVLSTLDAGRAARGLTALLPTRVLFYGALGLMVATLGLLTIAAIQARG